MALLVALGVVVCLAASASAIVADEMREMRELVLELQDRVEAQQRRIDAHEETLRASGLDERGPASGLGSFLERTDFSGWVSASYFWNFNNPRKPSAGGNGPFSNPFHADHNSFQFDEAWFVMDRAATEESPGGFHFEIVYGATATAFSNIENGSPDSGNLNGNDLWIPAANVSFRTPWGPTVTAGKFATTIGYEVAGAPNNVNVTRGFTYNLFQPISHTGVLVAQDFDNGFTYSLGVVNGFGTEQPNSNDSLGALWQLGWANDSLSLLVNGFYTDQLEGEGRDHWVLDGVAELTPGDDTVFWLNFDYINTDQDNENPWGVGVAVGGRVGIRENLGVGGRVEYAHFDDEGVATFTDGSGNVRAFDGDLWSFTGTLDYALTDELTGKVEAKYEKGHNGLGSSYKDGSGSHSDDAVFVGTQLYYEF
jgi:hypothetical protein